MNPLLSTMDCCINTPKNIDLPYLAFANSSHLTHLLQTGKENLHLMNNKSESAVNYME